MKSRDNDYVLIGLYILCTVGMFVFAIDLFVDMPYSTWLISNVPAWLSILFMCILCITTLFFCLPIKNIRGIAFIGAFYVLALLMFEYNIQIAPKINRPLMFIWLALAISAIAIKKLAKEDEKLPNKSL